MTNSKGFSGFLDGFASQNLASVARSTAFHWGQIHKHASSLTEQHAENRQNISLLTEASESTFDIKQLQLLGEAINTILTLKQDPREIIDCHEFRQIIYHFFEIADLTADTTALNMALDIGNKLKNYAK